MQLHVSARIALVYYTVVHECRYIAAASVSFIDGSNWVCNVFRMSLCVCLCMFSVVSLCIGLLKHFLHSLSPFFSPSLSLSLPPLSLSLFSGWSFHWAHPCLSQGKARQRQRERKESGRKNTFGTDELEWERVNNSIHDIITGYS